MLEKTPWRFTSCRPRIDRGVSTPLTSFLGLLALVLLLGGCVGNRKIVLLQDQEAFVPHESLVDKTWLPNAPVFTIRPGDVLMVTVEHSQLVKDIVPQTTLKNMDLYRSIQHPYLIGHTVDKEGNIEVPELGKVNLLGKTIREAEEVVLAKAAEYFSDPVVKVVMLNFSISVIGEVNRPGRYPVYNNEMNMLEGLALASDMTVLADRSRIRVMRSREGANHLYYVDLNDQNVLSNPYFYLQPNDVVIVDPLKRRKFTGRDPGVIISLLTFLVSVVSVYATLNR
ncbi:MAG: polysaccharide export protein [Flavobacteriales bacterium]|nr:polysaccharide export protein [Flavobacteriales bacterium]MBP9079017.1 polysaccharide export protein [Flavobacteriales bacterium]